MDKPVILIIDDDANLRKTLSDILRIKGYEPLSAKDGAEGITLLKDKSANLALIDLGLPDMSGMDVLERIKADHPLTEAIILTGNATLNSAVEATNKGAFSYLTKPYEIEQLMLHIRRVLEKQRTELALRESEERYRVIVNSVNLGISLIDLNHKIMMTNQFYSKLFHKPPADFVGKYCFKEFEKREAVCSHCPGALAMASGKPAEAETEGVRDDGSHFNVLLRTVPTFASDGTVSGFIEVIEDITERKQAEEALQASEQKFRTLFEKSILGILVVDLETMRFNYANPSMCRMFGYSEAELLELSVKDIHPKDSLDQVMLEFEHQMRGEKSMATEIPCLRKDGTVFYADINNAGIIIDGRECVMGFFVDITERRQAEAALRAASAKSQELEFIVNHSPAVAWLWKAAPGWPVEYVSGNFALYGYNPDDFTSGRIAFSSIVHPDDLPRLIAEVEQYTNEGRTEFTQEYRIVAKSGDVRWVDDRTWVRRGSDGSATHYQGIVIDITERKNAEKALAESRDHLRLINKIIRHDLLNDLGVIRSALTLYERSKEERFLDEATARIEKSLELIARMRELEAFVYSHGGLKPVSAGEVLRKVAENYKGIEFSIPCKGQVMADEALDSVIENIVSNAAKHSNTDRMDISMECVEEFCEIRIADHGIGIPDEIKSKIFEEGFVFGSTGQTGMGLYIVKKAMDHYGGSVHVEDNPDGGAVFVLRFRRVG